MKTMTHIAVSLAVMLATTHIAIADGIDSPVTPTVGMAPEPEGHDWTGPYIGAQLGFSDIALQNSGVPGSDGALVGLHAGYMLDIGHAVLGAEISYNLPDIEFGGGISSIDYFAELRLRAGYDFGTGILVYGAVGVRQVAVDTPIGQLEDQGFLVGLGAAYDLGNGWVFGSEITHNQIDNFDGSGANVEITTATARLSYRF